MTIETDRFRCEATFGKLNPEAKEMYAPLHDGMDPAPVLVCPSYAEEADSDYINEAF